MQTVLALLLGMVRRLGRSRRDLLLENFALRPQLAMCERRPWVRNPDRLLWAQILRRWPGWRGALIVLEPDTVVRWPRPAWRRCWTGKSHRRRPGRPRVAPETRALIIRMAGDNPRWGALRIVGELRALGLEVSASTVRAYRREALRRPPSPSWRTLLRLPAHEIWASDFFTVQTLTFRTLYVCVVISHQQRQIRHWNLTAHSTAAWVWQQVIEATPWNTAPGFWIRDRDTSYGRDFVAKTARMGIRTVLTPVPAPRANAIAERVIGTLRRECLDHLLVINERPLRYVLREYVTHYNAMRPHRSLGLDSPAGRPPVSRPPDTALSRRAILGGLHPEYAWAA